MSKVVSKDKTVLKFRLTKYISLVVTEETKHAEEDSKVKLKQEFSCKECGKTFEKKIYLRRHTVTIHKLELQCVDCDAKFSSKGDLKHHVGTSHKTSNLSLKCDNCQKSFKNQVGNSQTSYANLKISNNFRVLLWSSYSQKIGTL